MQACWVACLHMAHAQENPESCSYVYQCPGRDDLEACWAVLCQDSLGMEWTPERSISAIITYSQ